MSEPLTLAWDDLKAKDWGRFVSEAGPAPLEQSLPYGDAIAAMTRWTVARASVRRGRSLVALAQFFRRRLGPLEVARLPRGPVFAPELSDADREEVVRLLAGGWSPWRGGFLFWTPELEEGAEATRLLRAAGKRRMITGYSTVWIDLTRDPAALRDDMDRQFRRSLRKGEEAGLKIEATRGGAGLDWLVKRHEEERRRRRIVAAPSDRLTRALVAAQTSPQDVLVLLARDGSAPIAAMLFLRHGVAATYYIGATTPEGRDARAHHLLLNHALGSLKAAGARHLDLGGLNTDTMQGVAGFKLGAGGRLSTLTGTWF